MNSIATQESRAPILIAGAGPVGALLGLMLAQKGFSVHLVEKRPDLRKNQISAGRSINLALANRGIAALEYMGVMASIWPITLPMRGRMVHPKGQIPQFQAYGQNKDDVIFSVSRLELNKILLDAASHHSNLKISFQREITKIDLPNRKAWIQSQDDQTGVWMPYTCIFGADGVNSIVRQSILQLNGTVDKIMTLDHSYKEIHIPAGNDGKWAIEHDALHIWPRGDFMMIALPNPDGTFTGTLFLPTQGESSFNRLDTTKAVEAFFQATFPEAIPYIPQYADQVLNYPTGMLGTVKCSPWHYADSAAVLGDAAHAMVPFHGQGMNCGFEDVLELAHIVKHNTTWDSCLDQWERLRKPNADAITDMALANYIEMRSQVIDPRYLKKRQIEFELEKMFPGLFVPRYSRVMFHRIPYAQAKIFGERQDKILEALVDAYDPKIGLERTHAQELLAQHLGDLYHQSLHP